MKSKLVILSLKNQQEYMYIYIYIYISIRIEALSEASGLKPSIELLPFYDDYIVLKKVKDNHKYSD